MPDNDATIEAWWRARFHERTNWSRWGAVCSVLLHGLVLGAILLGLPYLTTPVPLLIEALPVDLVAEGAPGAAAALSGRPERAQEKSSELTQAEPAPLPVPRPDIAPKKRPPQQETRTLPLRSKTDRPARTPSRPAVSPQNGQSPAGTAVTDGNGQSGWRSTQSVKDFLRAQVERHLEFNVGALGTADVVVSIHVILDPDGHVRTADIVSDPRYASDSAFRSIADSARRAVLVASPLQVPAGQYDAFHDVVLDFDPRDVSQ